MFDDFTTQVQSDELAALQPPYPDPVDWAELMANEFAAELLD